MPDVPFVRGTAEGAEKAKDLRDISIFHLLTFLADENKENVSRPPKMRIDQFRQPLTVKPVTPPPPAPTKRLSRCDKRTHDEADPIAQLVGRSSIAVGGENFVILRQIGKGGFSTVGVAAERVLS